MKISIFGLGYVGCISLGCLAKNGHDVIGVDINELKVDLINKGLPTIIEKDIDVIISQGKAHNKISATTEYQKAIADSEVSIICVGTPSTKEGHLNLDYIYKTAEQIGLSLTDKNEFHSVAIRSTVLPGTNEKVGEIIEKYSGRKRNVDFTVVSNPEFLREGTAVQDYYNPPVTVLGGDNERGLKIFEEIYSQVNGPIVKVDIKTAEIIKYVNNTYHALKITFANEVGNICKKLVIDSHKVMDLFCMDKQLNISDYYFKPGFAYGGSCLPKDTKALRTLAHDLYLKSPVLESIENSNENQKRIAIDLIEQVGSKNIGFIGISFKPGTDDLRYSPAVDVAEYFYGKGYNLIIWDKNVETSKLIGANKQYINVRMPHLSDLIIEDIEDVIEKSDVIFITQKHKIIKKLIQENPEKIFIDTTRLFESKSKNNYVGICW